MRTSYKSLIKEALASKGLTNVSFGTLPDCKTVYTMRHGFGCCGSMSARTWKALYKRVQAALATL